MSKTKIKNFRLSDEAVAALLLLSTDKGVSQTAIIEMLLREAVRRLKRGR